MMIPRLSKSLCGCTLYVGSLVLAWLYFLSSLIGVTVLGFMGPIYFYALRNITEHAESSEMLHSSDKDAVFVATVIYAVVLSVCVVSTLINGCLLFGVYKRNHCLMMPHLIFAGVGVAFAILSNFLLVIMAFTSIEGFVQFLFHLVETALSIYFWLIIYSYFMEVKDESLQNQSTFGKF